jgi:hypothetical protein
MSHDELDIAYLCQRLEEHSQQQEKEDLLRGCEEQRPIDAERLREEEQRQADEIRAADLERGWDEQLQIEAERLREEEQRQADEIRAARKRKQEEIQSHTMGLQQIGQVPHRRWFCAEHCEGQNVICMEYVTSTETIDKYKCKCDATNPAYPRVTNKDGEDISLLPGSSLYLAMTSRYIGPIKYGRSRVENDICVLNSPQVSRKAVQMEANAHDGSVKLTSLVESANGNQIEVFVEGQEDRPMHRLVAGLQESCSFNLSKNEAEEWKIGKFEWTETSKPEDRPKQIFVKIGPHLYKLVWYTKIPRSRIEHANSLCVWHDSWFKTQSQWCDPPPMSTEFGTEQEEMALHQWVEELCAKTEQSRAEIEDNQSSLSGSFLYENQNTENAIEHALPVLQKLIAETHTIVKKQKLN